MAKKKKVVDENGQSPEALAIAPSSDEREARINALIEQASKDFGSGALTTLKGKHAFRERSVSVFSSGSLGLDKALGIGGLPRGRIVELYGPEAGGKTTLALQVIANAQKQGAVCAFIDAEHSLDVRYTEALGIDLENLLINQPTSGEEAMDLLLGLTKSGRCDLIVVDSVAALTPQAEIDGDVGDSAPGAQARLMSKTLRMATGYVAKTNTLVIFINQIRMKIGISFGNPETTSGGNALKFYASVRVDIRRIAKLNQNDEVIGNRVKMAVVKNKLAPPFRECEADLYFGKGISRDAEIVDYGVVTGVLKKNGAWYYYKENEEDVALGQGRVNAIANIASKEDLKKQIVDTFLASS